MHVGFQQDLLVVYILLIVVGPRRIVRWIRRAQSLSAKVKRRPPPEPGRGDVLRVFERIDERPLLCWLLAVLGMGLLFAGFFSAYLPVPGPAVPALYVVATALMLVGLLLI